MLRMSEGSHRTLKSLSEQAGESMQATLDRILEAHRRESMLQEANRAFAALRADPKAWAEELEERKLWESTLADGLDDE